MERLEERVERLEYYLSLLLNSMDRNQFPFYYLVMSTNSSRLEVEEFLTTCESLNDQLVIQKDEGFVRFESIYHKFNESIPDSLDIEVTIDTMCKQGIYKQLVTELKKYI